VDFKAKEARKGRHDDYISMNTKIDYHPVSHYEKLCPQILADIRAFMEQLFPNANVREYMWEHLASTLLGNNLNQSFNVYIGSGKNGKSKLVELMTRVLGQYKGTVPISLVTQKRTTIGNTSSEIYQLIGTRYAVMQEPSKGDVINEGVMKEITGGDPIVCRALFKDSVTFIPQFKLAVCTNNLFDIKSNDDGTWRRIRVVNFESKFTSRPYEDPEFPVDQYPYQFMLDTTLDEKFDTWAPVMLSLLVERAYQTQGRVQDCPEVLASSNRYRQSQDIYLDFIQQSIQEHTMPQPCNLKMTAVTDAFKNWYSVNHGGGKAMPMKDLKEYLNKKFGTYPKEGWARLSLLEGE
jgi:P4 family phage/plasmid primase-like protien